MVAGASLLGRCFDDHDSPDHQKPQGVSRSRKMHVSA